MKKLTPEQKQKLKKTGLKAFWKQLLKSDAHASILIDEFGAVKLYTNMTDKQELAYVLTYLANDLLDKAKEFDQLVKDEVREQVQKEIKNQELEEKDEMAEHFIKEQEEKNED